MHIALASDHGGCRLKAELRRHLEAQGHQVTDLGPDDPAVSVDYPDFAAKLALAMRDGAIERGLLVCGSGIGISIAANRFPWIRAALCHDATSARLCREHNDANVLALGERLIGVEVARDCVDLFLATPFAGGRHAGRVAKLTALVPEGVC